MFRLFIECKHAFNSVKDWQLWKPLEASGRPLTALFCYLPWSHLNLNQLITLSVVLERCSIFQKVCKHNVSQFHKVFFSSFWRYEVVLITTAFLDIPVQFLCLSFGSRNIFPILLLNQFLSQVQINWQAPLYNPSTMSCQFPGIYLPTSKVMSVFE